MLPITQYPKLSDETISMHETGISCWCIPTKIKTVSMWQDILDDGDDEIILTEKKENEDSESTSPTMQNDILLFESKIVSHMSGYTVIHKKSYNREYSLILTFKRTNDDIGRVFEAGTIFHGSNTYRVIEYTRHYVNERDMYISNCIYDSSSTLI
jgi:hypothetical protein